MQGVGGGNSQTQQTQWHAAPFRQRLGGKCCVPRDGLSPPPARSPRLALHKGGKTTHSPGLAAVGQAESTVAWMGSSSGHSGSEGGTGPREKASTILSTVTSLSVRQSIFDALIPWPPLPCQSQNLGLHFQGRTKQFCFLGKWEVWDGERSLWRGDYHSW